MNQLDEVWILGECLVDYINTTGNSFNAVAGGGPFNTAIAAATAGVTTSLLSRVGSGGLHEIHRGRMRWAKLSESQLIRANEPPGLAIAFLDDSGVASYSFYLEGTAVTAWRPEELPDPKHSSIPKAVHAGALSLGLPQVAPLLDDWLHRVSESNRVTVSIDPNVRPGFGAPFHKQAEWTLHRMRFTHLLKWSDADAANLFPNEDAHDFSASLAKDFNSHVVLSLGENGAVLYRPNGTVIEVAARKASVLVDTVAAGDTLNGAILAKLQQFDALGSDARLRLNALSNDNWRAILSFANCAASLVCERQGAQPPFLSEIESALASL